MPAVVYNIPRVQVGESVTASHSDYIRSTAQLEASRRGESSIPLGTILAGSPITASQVMAIAGRVATWTNTSAPTDIIIGQIVRPTHLNWLAQHLELAGTNPLYVPAGTNGYVDFATPGNYSFTLSSNTTEIRLIGIGAGGGGGGGAASGFTTGSGGGAGGWFDITIPATSNSVVYMTIGTGGYGTGAWAPVGSKAGDGSGTGVSYGGSYWAANGGTGGYSPTPAGVGGWGPSGTGASGTQPAWRDGGWGGASVASSYFGWTTRGAGDNGAGSGSTPGAYGGGGGAGGGSNDGGWRTAGSRGGHGFLRIYY